MKNIVLLVAAILFSALVSCSKQPFFLLLNNSSHNAFVEVPDGPRTMVASGQWVELPFSPSMKVSWDGKLRDYDWKYPSPPSEFMEFGKPAMRFALSLEPDGAIYARKVVDGEPSATIPDQPPGFPLAPL